MELGRIISEASSKMCFLAVVDTWFLIWSQLVLLRRMMLSVVIRIVALAFRPINLYLLFVSLSLNQ